MNTKTTTVETISATENMELHGDDEETMKPAIPGNLGDTKPEKTIECIQRLQKDRIP